MTRLVIQLFKKMKDPKEVVSETITVEGVTEAEEVEVGDKTKILESTPTGEGTRKPLVKCCKVKSLTDPRQQNITNREVITKLEEEIMTEMVDLTRSHLMTKEEATVDLTPIITLRTSL